MTTAKHVGELVLSAAKLVAGVATRFAVLKTRPSTSFAVLKTDSPNLYRTLTWVAVVNTDCLKLS